MVEAALVFPIVMAAVMIIFYVAIAFYMETAGSASLHISIRNEGAERAGTEIDNKDFLLHSPSDRYGEKAYVEENHKKVSKGIIFDTVKGFKSIDIAIPSIFRRHMKMENVAEFYIIDEMEYIRCTDLVKRMVQVPYS